MVLGLQQQQQQQQQHREGMGQQQHRGVQSGCSFRGWIRMLRGKRRCVKGVWRGGAGGEKGGVKGA